MQIYGLEIEVLSLISVGVSACMFLVWMWREWSWYRYRYKYNTQQTILGMQEVNENLFLRLQIEEAAQPQCAIMSNNTIDNTTESITEGGASGNTTADSIALMMSTKFLSLAAEIANAMNPQVLLQSLAQAKPVVIHPDPRYLDLSCVFQLTFFCALILLEYYFIHTPHLELAADNPTEQSIKRELQDFLLKKHPIANILVFAALAILSFFAWWNLLPRTTFLDIAFKVLISFAISGLIAFVVNNLIRIKVSDMCCIGLRCWFALCLTKQCLTLPSQCNSVNFRFIKSLTYFQRSVSLVMPVEWITS